MSDENEIPKPGVTRRHFLGSTGAVTLALGNANEAAARSDSQAEVQTGGQMMTLTVNGQSRSFAAHPRTTLVEALRDILGLTGTKIGCNQGQCGACTVLIDGRRMNSCLLLAMTVDGSEITTIEGLADPGGTLHPMQEAFAEHDAFQCGYCTPGQILSAIGCIEEGHAGSEAEIREYMSGNLCRCGAYPNIVDAVVSVRDKAEG